MASVWYLGKSSSYTITSAQWASVGAPGPDSVWNSSNGYSISQAQFSSAQVGILATMPTTFQLNAADGPRPGSNSSGGNVTDTVAPSAPSDVTATAFSPTEVVVAWGAAVDNLGVAYYRIMRDGSPIGTTAGLTYTDSSAPTGSSAVYSVAAVDGAGNSGVPAFAPAVAIPKVANTGTAIPIYEWESSKNWAVGQVVLYAGALYQCTSDHISGETFDSSNWDAITSSAGGTGSDAAPRPTQLGILQWDPSGAAGAGGYNYLDAATFAAIPSPGSGVVTASLVGWDKTSKVWTFTDPANFLAKPANTSTRLLEWDPAANSGAGGYVYLDPATIPPKPSSAGLLQWDPTANSGAGGYVYVDPASYAAVGAAFKFMLIESGEPVKYGMTLRSNGTRMPGSIVIGSLRAEIELPSVVNTTWRCIGYRTDGTQYTIATNLQLLANKRNVTSGVLNVTVAATDKILFQMTAGTAGAYMGSGITVVAALGTGATFPTDPTLGTPSTPTVTPSAVKLTVNIPPVTGATSYLIYRQISGVLTPYDEVSSTMTTYDDVNVVNGSSYTYAVAALAPGIMSSLSATVTATPTASYSYPSALTEGGAPQSQIVQLGGTANGQSVTVINTTTTPTLKLNSGNLGGANNADKVGTQFNVDGAKHFLFDLSGLYALSTVNAIFDLYLAGTVDSAGNGLTAGTSSTFAFYDGFQVEVKRDSVRLALKVSGGSFTTLIDYSTAGLTTGAITADGNHYYAFRAAVIDPGDGTFQLKWWQGASTSLSTIRSGGTAATLTASATSTQRASMTVGGLYLVQLGHTNTVNPVQETEASLFQSLQALVA